MKSSSFTKFLVNILLLNFKIVLYLKFTFKYLDKRVFSKEID